VNESEALKIIDMLEHTVKSGGIVSSLQN